ncbi:MAG TPA: selenide, water dikinase SelD, partial [Holophaga sp.]|nr:selenide, water dikinase SelD [Holophaga sp.]
LPLLPEVETYAAMGLVPEGAYRNREGRGRFLAGDPGPLALDLLFDPQTSGGLLAAVPVEAAEAALAALAAAGVAARIIGESGGPAGVVRIA